MAFKLRIFTIALGLMIWASLGEAQQQAKEADAQPSEQQEEAQTLPIPLPVEIVEGKEAAEARQRREEEARQREIEDLVAQQGMNAATQSIEAATRQMRDYALYSTILVFLGTCLLFWTLLLTRQANAAAYRAVEVTEKLGQAEVRAYVSVSEGKLKFPGDFHVGVAPYVRVPLRNSGATPAWDMRTASMLVVADSRFDFVDLRAKVDSLFDSVTPTQNLASNELVWVRSDADFVLDEKTVQEIEVYPAETSFFLVGKTTYQDVFGFTHTTRFSFKNVSKPNFETGGVVLTWFRTIEGNEAD